MPRNHPVSVIIPVFNALESLRSLIESLAQAYPRAVRGLEFRIVDDASTDSCVHAFYWEHSFFKRPDVSIDYLTGNSGYVASVNRGLRALETDSDAILLNSDTRIWGDFISPLQAVSRSQKRVASVTPLTNCGWIASLFDWPNGLSQPKAPLEPLVRCILSQSSRTSSIQIPSAVGFCTYLTSEAIKQVGLLDEGFSPGYAEEIEWSFRARRLGFHHLLSTGTFVEHRSNQTFGAAAKAKWNRRNLKTVASRYPDEWRELQAYLRLDPLAALRLGLIRELEKGPIRNRNSVDRAFL